MACTIEKVLADARLLVNRLKEHDGSADSLISQTQSLNRRVDAMKQYHDDLNELNEIARHRPRSTLILGLAQENSQIRELQAENKDLRVCLEEHQSALELIMSKYREQVFKLVVANQLDTKAAHQEDQSEEIREKLDRICEMVAVMQRAVTIDDEAVARDHELLTQLQVENKTLRELLQISVTHQSFQALKEVEDQDTQTDDVNDNSEGDTDTIKSVKKVKAKKTSEKIDNVQVNNAKKNNSNKTDAENGNNQAKS